MISHGKDLKIFAGNANRPLAEAICRSIGTRLGDSTVTHFADGEVSVSLYETVRGSDVFIIQPTCRPVNDHLMELLQRGGGPGAHHGSPRLPDPGLL